MVSKKKPKKKTAKNPHRAKVSAKIKKLAAHIVKLRQKDLEELAKY